MTGARRARRDQPALRRWGWLVGVVGIAVAATGGWLEYSDRPVAADPSIVSSPARTLQPPSMTKKTTPEAGKPSTTPSTRPPRQSSPSKPAPGRPTRIAVPKLEVSAAVIGIKARGGSLTPPANPKVIGWWSDGAQPGARTGSAVLTGHKVHTGGGAFDDLDQLIAGDEIVVTTDKGRLRYQVDSVTTYRKQALAKHAAEVFDQDVNGRLVLITCEDWNGSVYLSNAVVLAHRTA
jgi:LPXTG-site transpeptidase (sortase) family protein